MKDEFESVLVKVLIEKLEMLLKQDRKYPVSLEPIEAMLILEIIKRYFP